MTKLLFSILVTTITASVSMGQEPPKRWVNESQAGVIRTSGNSDTESYSLKQTSVYTENKDVAKVGASYLETSAENLTTGREEETARKWDAGLRYERVFSDFWSGFVAYLVESDKYAGYQQRHNSDIGGKYTFVKTETYDISSELGYRYVHQNNTNSTQEHFNAARVYAEANYRFNEFNSAKVWVEYIPNFDDSKDYLTNYEASISSVLSTMFSLKTAYLTKTDNRPVAGAERTDTSLTMALVAKF